MTALVRAEFLKLRTTQVWFWLLLAALAVAAVFVIGTIASGGVDDFPAPPHQYDVANLFTSAITCYIPVFVLGVLGVTTEFRYQTITPTVLATPSRWSLVSAKLITYAVVGAIYAACCVAIQLAVALPWLAAKHIHFSVGHDHVARALVGVFVVVTLFGIVGLGVGALLKNQIVAVVVGLIFFLVLNGLLSIIPVVKHVYPYTPGGAVTSIAALKPDDRVVSDVHVLPAWGGAVVLLLWALVPAIIGAGYTMNRDIT